MNLEKDVARAKEAEAIIENALVKEALDLIRSNLLAEIENSKVTDKDGRENAYRMLKVVSEFRRYFFTIMQTGKVAEHELTRLEKLNQKVRSIWQ